MSGAVFGSLYASAYDAMYVDKDYDAECDLIEQALRTYGDGATSSILDLGCGTGNHSIPLAERGFTVQGVDRSEEMLERAWAKAELSSAGDRVSFQMADLSDFVAPRPFDAVLMMFAVLGYQYENERLLASLRAVRGSLRPGGLFIGDVWYGPAVLSERPASRLRLIDLPDGTQMLRSATSTLDQRHHTCTVTFDLWRMTEDRILGRSTESHPMRFFFPLELEMALASAGLRLVRLGGFPNPDDEPDETTWNVTFVARAEADK